MNKKLEEERHYTEIEKFSYQGKNGKIRNYKKCLCVCGNFFKIRLDAKTKSCGCLTTKISARKNTGRISTKRRTVEDAILASARVVFRHHGYNDGDLSFEDFLNLSQLNCYYCSAPPSNTYHIGYRKDGTIRQFTKKTKVFGEVVKPAAHYLGTEACFIFNGIDRVDSNLTHLKNNVVPCCKICNWMKNKFSQADFLSQIEKIYMFQKNGKSII